MLLACFCSSTHGMLERWSVADGGKMFWKFFEPGFLKRCRGELMKSLVRPWSSKPSRGSCTVWCLERVTRMIFPYIFCPFRWLMARVKWNVNLNRPQYDNHFRTRSFLGWCLIMGQPAIQGELKLIYNIFISNLLLINAAFWTLLLLFGLT